MLINGVNYDEIINLKIEDVKKLHISKDLKKMILDFHEENNNKKYEYIFYTSSNRKISYKLINTIKNKYITEEIKRKCL